MEEPYKCANCGLEEFKKDDHLNGISRVMRGNAICINCGHPAPYDMNKDKLRSDICMVCDRKQYTDKTVACECGINYCIICTNLKNNICSECGKKVEGLENDSS